MRDIFYFLVILGLGILVGRESYRYQADRVDDARVETLIEALEKKPTIIHMHPLLPFPVPVPKEELPSRRNFT
jgi:hypothetical protein